MKRDDIDEKVAKFADNLLLEQEAMIERPGASRRESGDRVTSSSWAHELGYMENSTDDEPDQTSP